MDMSKHISGDESFKFDDARLSRGCIVDVAVELTLILVTLLRERLRGPSLCSGGLPDFWGAVANNVNFLDALFELHKHRAVANHQIFVEGGKNFTYHCGHTLIQSSGSECKASSHPRWVRACIGPFAHGIYRMIVDVMAESESQDCAVHR